MPTDEGDVQTQEVPGLHPEPPQDLHERQPSVAESEGPWVRLYPAHLDPIYFGEDPALAGRFSSPNGDYGVLYAAEDEFGAFIERFGHDTGVRVVDEVDLLERGLARIEAQRTFELVDLTGAGQARIGADSRLFAGTTASPGAGARRYGNNRFSQTASTTPAATILPARPWRSTTTAVRT